MRIHRIGPCIESVKRMAGPQPQIVMLSPPQQLLVEALLRQHSCPQALALRLRIVLGAAAGQPNQALAQALACSLPTQAQLAAVELHPADLRALVATILADAPRSGAPGSFSAEQIVQIINLACLPPPDLGRPIDAWTPRELADEAVKQAIVSTISARSVGRFLKRGRSAPAP
jgi:putative transposase